MLQLGLALPGELPPPSAPPLPEDEEWANIDGFPGYEISSHGRIRSRWFRRPGELARSIHSDKSKILRWTMNHKGYLAAGIYDQNRKLHTVHVHKLVASAFLKCPPDLHRPYVNHIDGNGLNNHASNLEWISPSGNTTHFWSQYNRGLVNRTMRLERMRAFAIANGQPNHPCLIDYTHQNGHSNAQHMSTPESELAALRAENQALHGKCHDLRLQLETAVVKGSFDELATMLRNLVQECDYSATSGLPFNSPDGKGHWTQLANARTTLQKIV